MLLHCTKCIKVSFLCTGFRTALKCQEHTPILVCTVSYCTISLAAAQQHLHPLQNNEGWPSLAKDSLHSTQHRFVFLLISHPLVISQDGILTDLTLLPREAWEAWADEMTGGVQCLLADASFVALLLGTGWQTNKQTNMESLSFLFPL